MTNISHVTWSYMDKSPVIRKCFGLDIINLRALAMLIIKSEKLKTSPDSVISALRRYEAKEPDLQYLEVKKSLNECKISTKTKIVLITLKREPKYITKILQDITKVIDATKGDVFRFIEGRESAKVIIDERNLSKVKHMLGRDIIEINDDICEINICFPELHTRTAGLRAMTLTELAVNDIKIIETVSCLPEFMIFVREQDIAKAYQLLLDLYYSRNK